jgi:DNA phosphorothioation-associated putative methyltransferase
MALRDGVLTTGDEFFDFGCGHGEDVEFLKGMGFRAAGWDPVHRSSGAPCAADVVNLGYVVNVIEDPEERKSTLKRAYDLARGVLVVSALVGYGDYAPARATPYADGHVTTRGTFQKYFQQDELAEYVNAVTGGHPYVAGIGCFYVFKDPQREANYCRSLLEEPVLRVAPRAERGHYQLHSEVLGVIAQAVRRLGRLPLPDELPEASSAIAILAYSDDWVARLSGQLSPDELTAVRHARRGEVLLELVSSYFSESGKLRLADMNATMCADVRSMFGSISRAYREADELIGRLFRVERVAAACQAWKQGKATPDGLYFHSSLEQRLPFELALVVRAARVLAGDVAESTNLVKIGTRQLSVSFGEYPSFDKEAHPGLRRSIRVDFESGQVSIRDYADSSSPPILHRKELLVGRDYGGYERFRRLSRAEERLGLLGRRDIGTRGSWAKLLAEHGVVIRGHAVHHEGDPLPQDDEQNLDAVEDLLGESDITEAEQVFKTVRLGVVGTKPPRERWTPEVVDALAKAMSILGRPPLESEVQLPAATVKRFGATRDWQAILGKALDLDRYEDVRRRIWSDWIVRLGTARFSGREQFRRMSLGEQADIRFLFGSYRQAFIEADQWLFRIGKADEIEEAIRSWPQGRHHEEKGLYLHASLEPRLPILLRLLVNCGRYLVADVLPPRVDVLRIALDGRNVKFYCYEGFDIASPSRLLQTAKVDFRRRRVIARNCAEDREPRRLAVKHDLVDISYPAYEALKTLAPEAVE